MIKKVTIFFVIVFCTFSKLFAGEGIEGNYCYTNNKTKIYLKIKKVNDTIFYFILKDYDTTQDEYKQRQINGSFKFVKNTFKLVNISCYPYYHFSFVRAGGNMIRIDTAGFKMYQSFSDIKGVYIKESDSVRINYNEFTINMIPQNIIFCKKNSEIILYDFPSKYSFAKSKNFKKDEKLNVITTVGDFLGNKPLPSEMLRFSLVEVAATKERKWVNTDNLEDLFKAKR